MVSFLPAPTSVSKKAARQPVGGKQLSDSNAGSADASQPSVHFFALRLMLFVLRSVFLHGKHTDTIRHLFSVPIPWLPRTWSYQFAGMNPDFWVSISLRHEISNTSQMNTSSTFSPNTNDPDLRFLRCLTNPEVGLGSQPL